MTIMNKYTLKFNNKELEDKYQNYSKTLFENSLDDYFRIQNIGVSFMIFNWIIKQDLQHAALTAGYWLATFIINLIFRCQKCAKPYLPIYLCAQSIIWSSFQILLLKMNTFQTTTHEDGVTLDVILQFSNLFIIGQNHITSSLLYLYFVIIRIYVQANGGFSYISITFLVFSYFYVINQYRQTKAQRQMFLKTLRNRCFDHLIDDFIDQNIMVIQKDEENITFTEINKSKGITALFDSNINQVLKQMIVPQYKTTLETYLYNTQQQNEKLICFMKGQVFKVTYEYVAFQKVEFFIKFSQLILDKVCRLNYKQLYYYQKQCVEKLLINNQVLKQFDRQLQWKQLIYCFQHYYYGYIPKISQISFEQFLFECNFINVTTNIEIECFQTDVILLKMLFKILQKIINYDKIIIQSKDDIINFTIIGMQLQKDFKSHVLIDRILFHIGIGKLKFQQKNEHIQISFSILSILDKKFIK